MMNVTSSCGAASAWAPAVCLSLVVFAPKALAQARADASSRAGAMVAISGVAAPNRNRPEPPDLLPSELLREIDDPSLGQRWLLYRDPRHPAGPGRLVAVGAAALGRPEAASSAGQGPAAAPRPVIRAGDRVVLEENTPVVEARLQAIALLPAFAGSPLKVRLLLGGKTVPAIAIAPGRVALARQPEEEP